MLITHEEVEIIKLTNNNGKKKDGEKVGP